MRLISGSSTCFEADDEPVFARNGIDGFRERSVDLDLYNVRPSADGVSGDEVVAAG